MTITPNMIAEAVVNESSTYLLRLEFAKRDVPVRFQYYRDLCLRELSKGIYSVHRPELQLRSSAMDAAANALYHKLKPTPEQFQVLQGAAKLAVEQYLSYHTSHMIGLCFVPYSVSDSGCG
jgi:hypothetical protein